ncbi:hypothetical protein [Streptomyces cinereoruber]|uniref:hypothetical protein n=1 Tax=Streptomyces cinereoruber TaxID=67260 RepID=UPI0036506EEE
MYSFGQLSNYDVNTALGALRKIRNERSVQLRKEYSKAETAARTFTDPHLNAEGLKARRDEMLAQARAALAAAVQQMEAEAKQAADTVRRYTQDKQSAASADPNAQLLAEMRQGKAWDRARALLDSGRSPAEVIATADVDTLRALRTELPTYLATQVKREPGLLQAHSQAEPFDPAPVLRTIDLALAEKIGGTEGQAMRYALDLAAVEPGVNVTLKSLRTEALGLMDSTARMSAAMEAHYVDQEAARTLALDAPQAVSSGPTPGMTAA